MCPVVAAFDSLPGSLVILSKIQSVTQILKPHSPLPFAPSCVTPPPNQVTLGSETRLVQLTASAGYGDLLAQVEAKFPTAGDLVRVKGRGKGGKGCWGVGVHGGCLKHWLQLGLLIRSS